MPYKCTVVDCNDSHRCMAVKIEGLEVALVCINAYLSNFANNDDYEEEILQYFAFKESTFNQYANGNSKCF